jgi:two-component system, sensor histidine kinase RegB
VIINEHRVKPSEAGFWKSEADADSRLSGETARHLALRWVVRLRYGLIVGEVALIAVLSLGLQIPLPVVLIGPAIAIQALSNWLLRLKMDRLGGSAEHLVGMLFGLDTVCLTVILALSGGPANPFSLLYLVQITFSAVVLRKLWTWTLGVFSTLSFGLLFWVSRDVSVFHEHGLSGGISVHLLGMWIAFATAALLISFFVARLSAEARSKEREIRLMQRRLARNDRLASLVTLSAGAAHEMATPLATIAVTAKEMEHDANVRLGDRRMREDAELETLLADVRKAFPDAQDRIRIHMDEESSRTCVIPVRAAVEALSALVKNALDASSDGKPVLVRAVHSDNGRVRFIVQDEGIGMSAEVMERVAEPFFTTKAAGQGMGLGAFLAHLFAQTLGGQLSFESEPGRGCTATLELPDMKHVES